MIASAEKWTRAICGRDCIHVANVGHLPPPRTFVLLDIYLPPGNHRRAHLPRVHDFNPNTTSTITWP